MVFNETLFRETVTCPRCRHEFRTSFELTIDEDSSLTISDVRRLCPKCDTALLLSFRSYATATVVK